MSKNISFCDKLYDLLYSFYANDYTKGFMLKDEDEDMFICNLIEDYEYVIETYDDLIKKYKNNSLKNIEVQITTQHPNRQIKIRKSYNSEGQKYVCITLYMNTNNVILDLDDEYIYLGQSAIVKTFIFHDNMSVYTSSITYYPSSVYDMSFMPKEMQDIIFPLYSNGSLLWKDFVTDRFYPSLKIEELSKYHNKKDYFESVFRIRLPKHINKHDAKNIFCKCCAAHYINENQLSSLWNADFDYSKSKGFDRHFSMKKKKEFAELCIKAVLKNKNPNIKTDILEDYVNMSIELKEPIDILAGKRRICELHDYLTDRYVIKINRGKKLVIPETPLKYLNLPKPFTLLKTKKSLISEGKVNHNCVGGYIDKINKGKCIIYTAIINGEHITIEICYRKSKKHKFVFYVNQCYKSYNRPCSEKTSEYVNDTVNEYSLKAISNYEKAIRKKGRCL